MKVPKGVAWGRQPEEAASLRIHNSGCGMSLETSAALVMADTGPNTYDLNVSPRDNPATCGINKFVALLP